MYNYSAWRSAATVTQAQTNQTGYAILNSRQALSQQPVSAVATSAGRLVTTEPNAIAYTGFAHTGMVRAIELELHVSRLSRITDQTIQLIQGNTTISENLARSDAADVAVYVWTDLNINWTHEHGVLLDFQPHPQYPSSNLLYVRRVRLRFA